MARLFLKNSQLNKTEGTRDVGSHFQKLTPQSHHLPPGIFSTVYLTERRRGHDRRGLAMPERLPRDTSKKTKRKCCSGLNFFWLTHVTVRAVVDACMPRTCACFGHFCVPNFEIGRRNHEECTNMDCLKGS